MMEQIGLDFSLEPTETVRINYLVLLSHYVTLFLIWVILVFLAVDCSPDYIRMLVQTTLSDKKPEEIPSVSLLCS
jgi:hypothetical protein